MSSVPPPIVGWTYPSPHARKQHYFDANEAMSLCGNWMLFVRSPLQMSHDAERACKACRTKLDARKEAA